MRAYVNLSNGLFHTHALESYGLLRIQSTHLEQKLMGKVLAHLPYDFVRDVWLGRDVWVLDTTVPQHGKWGPRSLWQGIPWIRYAMDRTWDREGGTYLVKNHDASALFSRYYDELQVADLHSIRYFTRFPDEMPGLFEAPPAGPVQIQTSYQLTFDDGNLARIGDELRRAA